jgi:dsRNA-specific ribonuclease
VRLQDGRAAQACAPSKRAAQQRAAEALLDRLGEQA